MTNIQLIKVLLPYLRPYAFSLIAVVLLLPLSSITYSVQPMILQRAIDGPILDGNLSGLWTYVLVLLAAVVFNFFLQIIQFLLMNNVGQNVVANVRLDLFSHLEKLSMSFFDKTPVGRSVSRITSDMEQLAESFVGGLVLILLDLFNIVGILAFMFYLDWRLSLAVSLFLIPIYLITTFYQKLYRMANLKARKELSKLNSFLQQNIVGISVVQVLNSTAKSMRKFEENNHKYFKANDESIKADAQLSACIETVSIFAIVSLIFISSRLGAQGSGLISIGIIIAFIQYAQSLFEPIRNLSDRFTVIQSAFTAIERMNELLDAPIEIKDPEVARSLRLEARSEEKIEPPASSLEPLIEFSNVHFRYKSVEDSPWILKGLSFSVMPGQKVAIIGRTGSGKSTIIKLLTRLYEVDKGSIKINGVDIKDLKQDDIRENIAVIHQDSYIFAGDLEANIKLGREGAKLDMKLAEPFLDAAPNLERDQELAERGGNISAGEEQVINFARAVVTDPPILVLDEATAKIDVGTEKKIQAALKNFLKNKTAIIIAHRLETIKECDLVIEIKDGRLV